MIESILPSQVASAEAFGDLDEAELFPEEEEIVARAVESRRRGFATARACARRALADLGAPVVAIPRSERRAPRWPEGVVGSITHCDGYRGAAVAWAREVATVGIDAEPHEPLPDGILARISLPPERERLAELAGADPAVRWDRLLFCAKEATYKAWFPLMRAWLGFEQAEVSIDPARGSFASRLLVPGPQVAGRELQAFDGRWVVHDGLVATAIAVQLG